MRKWLIATAILLCTAAVAVGQNYGSTPYDANGLTNSVKTVKASRGLLQVLSCYNPNSSAAYVQVFDTASAPTVGVTAPRFSIGFGATSSQSVPLGVGMLNAIKIAATQTATGSSALDAPINCTVAFQ